ncbi:hypothetical protein Cgig2_012469 [Carnegiea gigantea]|uniref:BAH domain-containing protein n=1 Tax=Carnegiea gigantea TaxID=171969 RepID=A0A9Q1KMQ5_9CARY|nr:hypothetical protein Cgig2_012469 [Carnegiea gigantea]
MVIELICRGCTMSHLIRGNQEEDFRWGTQISVSTSNNDIRYYRSFIYGSVEYSLYDCVCLFREGAKETDIGQLIRIWENKQGRRVKILWFFRPIDIRSFLRDYEPSWNELFLASGEGKGLCSIVPLEAIVGKCSVICTSKDCRNTLPSKSDLGKAEYFFSHAFDVGNLRISEEFPDKIDMVRVERLFNQEKDKLKANVECITGVAGGARERGKSMHSVQKDGQVGMAETRVTPKDSIVKDETSRTSEEFKQHRSEYKPLNNLTLKDSVVKDVTSRTSEDFKQYVSENQPLKKRKIQIKEEADSANLVPSIVEDPKSILDPLPSYGGKSPPTNLSNSYNQHQSAAVADKEASLPAKRTTANKDKRSWFYGLPWEEKLKNAEERGTLVYLDNLDPSFTSSDIQNMITKVFKVEADARVIPGQALVDFNSKDDADFVVQELREKCLMIGGRLQLKALLILAISPAFAPKKRVMILAFLDRRPVVATRKHLGELGKSCSFPGCLIIEKSKKWKWSEDKKHANELSRCKNQPKRDRQASETPADGGSGTSLSLACKQTVGEVHHKPHF